MAGHAVPMTRAAVMAGHAVPMPGEPLPPLAFDTLDRGRLQFDRLDGWRMLVIYRGKHCGLCARYLATLRNLRGGFAKLGAAVPERWGRS
jgi:hypothetical protein